MKLTDFNKNLKNGDYDVIFGQLYGEDENVIMSQRRRYEKAAEEFARLYPNREDIAVYSAPGRTEVGGNHTDHQHGCVLAAAINLDIIAVVSFHNDGVIRIHSEGYPEDCVDLSDLSVHSAEKGTSASLIRGIASRFSEIGVNIGGFDAYTVSDVLGGSGLSSSAAFEVLIGTIIDSHYNSGKAGAVEIAKIGQYSENEYFGKKSGLMDQMVSSVGGFVFIDFESAVDPVIKKIECGFETSGYQLCITDTKASHADLTDDYVSVPEEMNLVAKHFGKSCLREVNFIEFYKAIPELRKKCSDRAILRSAHFFSENERAGLEAAALSKGSFDEFLSLVKESGDSSAKWLQNLYSCSKPQEQGIPLAVLISEKILKDKGAVRVHGGGFAGTIQAFVPLSKCCDYENAMNELFGDESCYRLKIRNFGGINIAE